MGTDFPPIIANLILCCYVTVYDKIPKDRSKHDLVDKFNHTFKCLGDALEFQKCAKEIYPKELTLNKSNISNDRIVYLTALKIGKINDLISESSSI